MRVAIFGGTGGLGKKVAEILSDNPKYYVHSLGSSDVNILSIHDCEQYFKSNLTDVVINMAGNNVNGFIHKIGACDSNAMINLQCYGSMNIASACLPGMRRREFGRIIMISSILATHNVLGTGVYSSCKAFIDRLVKSISNENIGKGITANSLQLGYFDAGMTYKLQDPEKVRESIPLKRFGEIKELVNAIEFLINTEYATGINLPLTGGVCF